MANRPFLSAWIVWPIGFDTHQESLARFVSVGVIDVKTGWIADRLIVSLLLVSNWVMLENVGAAIIEFVLTVLTITRQLVK